MPRRKTNKTKRKDLANTTDPFGQSGTRLRLLVEDHYAGAPVKSGRYLSNLHKRFLLWAYSEKFSTADISRLLGITTVSVRNFIRIVEDDYGVLLDIACVIPIESANSRRQRWACRWCGVIYSGTAPAANHAALHIFNRNQPGWFGTR